MTEDLRHMHELARSADVFASAYRGLVNRRVWLEVRKLAAQSERGIVCMTAIPVLGPTARALIGMGRSHRASRPRRANRERPDSRPSSISPTS